MQPLVEGFRDAATGAVSYLVADLASGRAAIIDPVLDFDPGQGRVSTASADAILQAAEARGLTVGYVLETHLHADHLSAGDYIRARTAAAVVVGARVVQAQRTFIARYGLDDLRPDGAAFDRLAAEGDSLPLGGLTIDVMETPGHSLEGVTYLVGGAAFVGDTLLMPDCGTARADFPGGDACVLYRSIRRILALPPRTRLFVGHDYPPPDRPAARFESTVADQRAGNLHVHGMDERAFTAFRTARDATLAPPALRPWAEQVNIRAGALPPRTASGGLFLRLPIAIGTPPGGSWAYPG